MPCEYRSYGGNPTKRPLEDEEVAGTEKVAGTDVYAL